MLNLILMAMPVTNDEQKFTRLYNEYYKYVFGIASKFFENNMDKEDAVYTSFLKISFNISKVKDIYSRETKAFVATITRNTCITLLNKKNKIKEIYIENLNEIPDDTDGFETLEEEQLLVTYKSCLKKLTKNQYDILYLRYVNELSLKEIAVILDIKENAVKQRIYNAKQKLSGLIKEAIENE